MSYDDMLKNMDKESHYKIHRKQMEKVKLEQRNDHYKKFDKYMKADEQKRTNKHSEGYCYGCSTYEQILQNLWHVCSQCYQKRGKEGVIATQNAKYSHELCDLCGFYKMQTHQLNISLCTKCQNRVSAIWAKYRKDGGYEKTHPLNVEYKKVLGKDWEILKDQES